MRILVVSSLYEPYLKGGAEVIATILARGLDRRGHMVGVATTNDATGIKTDIVDGIEIRRYGIRNSYWPSNNDKHPAWRRSLWHLRDRFNIEAANDIADAAKSFVPDIAVCHNLTGFSVSTWKALSDLSIPVVQVLHDYYALCPRSSLFKNGRNCQSRCLSCRAFRRGHPSASKYLTGVISVSEATLGIHERFGMFDNVPIKRIVYNARSMDTLRSKPEAKAGELVFGFIGRLSPEKGIEPLIEAFKEYSLRFNQARLLVAGEGEPNYVKSLMNAARGFPIDFLGRVKSADFYTQLHVCIVPSIWQEPLGMVAIEALAHGAPVIGSNRGGIPEIVRDHHNGLIFNPDEENSLYNALLEVTKSSDLLRKLSDAAIASVNRFTDEARMLEQHESLYSDVIQFHKLRR